MEKLKIGEKFKVCGISELIKRGWIKHSGFPIQPLGTSTYFRHDDFPGCSITEKMIINHEGNILTVVKESRFTENWYWVNENIWEWPAATFLKDLIISNPDVHICVEGATPIDGWVICKTCGKDLWLSK